jgi:ribosomal protein L23
MFKSINSLFQKVKKVLQLNIQTQPKKLFSKNNVNNLNKLYKKHRLKTPKKISSEEIDEEIWLDWKQR